MKRRLYALASVLLIAMLAVSPVYAGGVSIKVGLGSITVDITAWGVGKDATAKIYATGIPYAWCYAPGNGNPAPGQNPSNVTAQGGGDLEDGGKGKFTAFLAGQPDFTGWTAIDFGCSNNNWGYKPYFVEWKTLTVEIFNSRGEWFTQNYECTTKYIPDYTLGDGNTFNDGTIECTQVP